MKISKHVDIRLSNWKRNTPVVWSMVIAGLATLFNSAIPIIANIRSMNDNLKHDLSTVVFPSIVQILLFLGIFMVKSNSNNLE